MISGSADCAHNVVNASVMSLESVCLSTRLSQYKQKLSKMLVGSPKNPPIIQALSGGVKVFPLCHSCQQFYPAWPNVSELYLAPLHQSLKTYPADNFLHLATAQKWLQGICLIMCCSWAIMCLHRAKQAAKLTNAASKGCPIHHWKHLSWPRTFEQRNRPQHYRAA